MTRQNDWGLNSCHIMSTLWSVSVGKSASHLFPLCSLLLDYDSDFHYGECWTDGTRSFNGRPPLRRNHLTGGDETAFFTWFFSQKWWKTSTPKAKHLVYSRWKYFRSCAKCSRQDFQSIQANKVQRTTQKLYFMNTYHQFCNCYLSLYLGNRQFPFQSLSMPCWKENKSSGFQPAGWDCLERYMTQNSVYVLWLLSILSFFL